MAKHIRYKGEFLSRAGVVWRVELLQEAAVPFASVGDLVFDADEALVIEWADAGKDRTICGSTATIRIESPGDRTYEDLYTIAPGRIRLAEYFTRRSHRIGVAPSIRSFTRSRTNGSTITM